MNRPATRHRTLSIEDYLALEERSPVRHEYVGGHIYAMTGASKRHNRIAGNIFRHLAAAAEGGPCRVYVETVKLRVDEDTIYYPDVMVACGPENDDPLIEDAPCLVVEVTSPGTRITDRREKLAAYLKIPSLQAYVIVEQARRRVERHWRTPQAEWRGELITGESQVRFPCPEFELSLAQIYAGVGEQAPDP